MVLNKNNIMMITTIMIVLLVIALIVIFMHYLSFREDTVIKRPITTPTNKSSGEIKESNPSGEIKIDEPISGEEVITPVEVIDEIKEQVNEESKDKKEDKNNKTSKDNKIDANNNKSASSGETVSQMPNTIIDVTDNGIQEPVITSSVDTSNQEKQQVLNELDDALKGLLEVVGKVPTVDENKLDASLESEVQP